MGLLGKLIKTGINLIEVPIAIVKDTATMGGALTDQDIPYTAQKAKEIGKTLEQVKKEVEKL